MYHAEFTTDTIGIQDELFKYQAKGTSTTNEETGGKRGGRGGGVGGGGV
jgi:hypothetical protein